MSQKQTGKLVRVTWLDLGTREATLEIRHSNGDMTFLVVDINRRSNRIPRAKLAPPDGPKPKRRRR